MSPCMSTPRPLRQFCPDPNPVPPLLLSPSQWEELRAAHVPLLQPEPSDRRRLRALCGSASSARVALCFELFGEHAHSGEALLASFVEGLSLLFRHGQGAEHTLSGRIDTAADPWVQSAPPAPTTLSELPAWGVSLKSSWVQRVSALSPGSPEHLHGERLLRILDDLFRGTLFSTLHDAWLRQGQDWPFGPPTREYAKAKVSEHLGEDKVWIKSFKQYTQQGVRRLVVIPTWECELRCTYCWIPKQSGREMDATTMSRAIEFLLSTQREEVILQFFGGEPLINDEMVFFAMDYGLRRAAELGKKISFVLSSNGWSLTPARMERLATYPVRLELSLDGRPETQRMYRPARDKGGDSYANSILTYKDAIQNSGLVQQVIMVVHNRNVDAMPEDFFHLVDNGYHRIQINFMQGLIWTKEQMQSFAKGLMIIGQGLKARKAQGIDIELINIRERPMAMRLNGEVTVDHDGTIYSGNSFLHETERKDRFRVAHLDDYTGIDRYWVDAAANEYLLQWSYKPKITENNLKVGRIMASFCKWLVANHLGVRDVVAGLPATAPEGV